MPRDLWNYAKYANLALSLGITMGASIFSGLGLGRWLDRRLGTSPWLMVLGALLGVGLGFYSLVKEIGALENEAERKKKK
ncbi:MAG: AtpZ/AtpI family protein [Thermoanaerobacteraceae bacterium]|uniref:AtpZ/AtpI family protein n=1 Tax=Thermanaeromonas sp. C210 TaxID=2731925 RepID=UPI00155D59FB|nr:AtpZ/AtpI family protein [Thermanaeromonas sp. C210]MBE3580189.1 AtpZ/AtpI family protein [Thermoanaerobacteraceae bacterium]GFN22976.1 hypothetical protein TAMC210_12930 [Thermanaeromonas sp. C210]